MKLGLGRGPLKTNTVLQYDANFQKVESWGFPALAQRYSRRRNNNSRPVELFKLHLINMSEDQTPALPEGLNYKKAITDYLCELGELIKSTIDTRWPQIEFFKNVLIILTVPVEFSEKKKGIMKQCAYNAGLIKTVSSSNLKLITEPEAAAIYCMRSLKEFFRTEVGTSFLIVDIGGGTVDLTIRKLLSESNYGLLQYMVQEFCRSAKIPFTGEKKDFKTFELDLEELCPVLKNYVDDTAKKYLEELEWVIEIEFDDVKGMFDPVIGRIIRLIRGQLDACKNCTAMFLVGGFSEFKEKVPIISSPDKPIAAIVRGALLYGLDTAVVKSRVLRYTYGIRSLPDWQPGDPVNRRTPDGKIYRFHTLIQRGKKVEVNEEVSDILRVAYADQVDMCMDIYVTRAYEAKYCDEPGVELLGKFTINMPDKHKGLDRLVVYTLSFGETEIRATARNQANGNEYHTIFELNFE
ncbi:actin-like ATPase domain-containing protein [Gigaspora margarita]|uniref:Actin-like ATPase domain-containing protein n=1 Tax=Gigaspora margarita TaxID=4874 RepID=A0A8H4AY54_GIGMA|nr:actin-like ATPase domain-containing protein [Gigaspora margarita]